MPYIHDLFGRLCWQAHQTGAEIPLELELDNRTRIQDFSARHYVTNQAMRAIETEFLSHATDRALDLGTGPGRVALHLQGYGHEVVGVDKSPHMARLARARGVNVAKFDFNSPLPTWKLDDRLFFDTALLFGNGFGCPGTVELLEGLLVNLLDVTTEGAIAIGEGNDPAKMQKQVDMDYQKRNLRLGRREGERRWRYRSGEQYGEWHRWMQVSPDQLNISAQKTGWQLTRWSYEPPSGPGAHWGAYFAVLKKN